MRGPVSGRAQEGRRSPREVNGTSEQIDASYGRSLGDRRKKIAKLVWQIDKSLSLRDKRQSTTAEPLELACCLPISGGDNLTRARVDRVWFSGKHPPIIPVALCRGFYGLIGGWAPGLRWCALWSGCRTAEYCACAARSHE
jgi:hypothetical protein